jgi:hypothetical protein
MADRRDVPRESIEQQSERAFGELARLLAIASERRAKMAASVPAKRGGREAA